MHDVPTRQLIALSAAFLVGCSAQQCAAQETRAPEVSEQVQAAKLKQAALAASAAKPEDWRDLEQTYTRLVARYPRDVTVLNARAEFLWDIGERSRAVTEWKLAEKIDPRDSRILNNLGESALALGDAREAATYFARIVDSDPRNAAAHFALANVWFLFRHELIGPSHPNEEMVLNEALAHFAAAARLSPENLEYARSHAETFYSLAKPDWPAALEAWRRVQELSPDKDFALGNLARVHLKMGQFDASKECLSKMLSPDFQRLRNLLKAQIDAISESAARDTPNPPRVLP